MSVYKGRMNSSQFRRSLAKQGCTVEVSSGKGGHAKVALGDKVSFVPTHGGRKQLGTGLMKSILKDLGL